MKLYKIDLYTPKGGIYFRTEEIYCESLEKCTDLYMEKYSGCNFEITEYEI